MRRKKVPLIIWIIFGVFILYVLFNLIGENWDPYTHRFRFGHNWQKPVTSSVLVQPVQKLVVIDTVQPVPAPGPVVPSGIPSWLVIALAIVLPFAYQLVLMKFSGVNKTLITYAISGVITILITMLAKKPQGWDQIGWIWALQNLSYHLLTKPLWSKIEAAKRKE